LRSNEGEEKKRLGELPHFDVLNGAREHKPAALVLATVTDGQHEYPALVTHRFGRGRTAALLIGDFWQAGFGDEARQKDLGKAWRQIVRWLVADVPERIELRVEQPPGSESVRLETRVRDPVFQPLENAAVTLKVQPLGAPEPVTLAAETSATEPGLYETTYVPRASGGFRVEAVVANESGALLGTTATGWTTDLAAAEFKSLSPNRPLMQLLASKTRGELLTPDRLSALARELPARRAPVMEAQTRPLWHTPWVFAFALACFGSEWALRRVKGLA
jgi:hypothetical protein